MESVFLVTAIIGFIESVKAVNENDWQTASIIWGAAIIGGITGFAGVDHLTITSGIQYGLSAAGSYKALKLVGGTQ